MLLSLVENFSKVLILIFWWFNLINLLNSGRNWLPIWIQLIMIRDHFIVVYLVAKPLIWSEAEGDLVVIVTSI